MRSEKEEKHLQQLRKTHKGVIRKGGRISRRHENFAYAVVSGLPQWRAYKDTVSRNPADATMDVLKVAASKLANRPDMKELIERLRKATWDAKSLSLSEKRAFLADVVRTPVGEVDETSPLAQEVTTEHGEFGTKKKVKMPDKTKAIELDSKIAGDFYSDREGVKINPFSCLLLVANQEKQADAIDV
jgi:hypothetical protein